MPNYRRVWVPGSTCFFTVNLADRQRTLLLDHIAALRSAFRIARAARPFDIHAIVVLPEHLHCIWQLPADDADNATRWRHIKTLFSQSIMPDESRTRRRAHKNERGVWQRGYWERLLRGERDLRTHVDYIHFNPVKHGHVDRVRDWPPSSFHRHVAQGDLPPDWGGP